VADIREISLDAAGLNGELPLLVVDAPDGPAEQLVRQWVARGGQAQFHARTSHPFWLKQQTESAKKMLPETDIEFITKWLCTCVEQGKFPSPLEPAII
jgi:hypothetical protein